MTASFRVLSRLSIDLRFSSGLMVEALSSQDFRVLIPSDLLNGPGCHLRGVFQHHLGPDRLVSGVAALSAWVFALLLPVPETTFAEKVQLSSGWTRPEWSQNSSL